MRAETRETREHGMGYGKGNGEVSMGHVDGRRGVR